MSSYDPILVILLLLTIFAAESLKDIQKGGKTRSLGALFRPKEEEKVMVLNL